jgi:hypothetical protein
MPNQQMQDPEEKPVEDQLIEFLQDLEARVTALEQKETNDVEEVD